MLLKIYFMWALNDGKGILKRKNRANEHAELNIQYWLIPIHFKNIIVHSDSQLRPICLLQKCFIVVQNTDFWRGKAHIVLGPSAPSLSVYTFQLLLRLTESILRQEGCYSSALRACLHSRHRAVPLEWGGYPYSQSSRGERERWKDEKGVGKGSVR